MVFLGMKRSREEGEIDNITMANYLMLLSQGGETFEGAAAMTMSNYSPNRVFECKTCNRQFPSFQALGGHRASHKKPRLMENNQTPVHEPPVKPKTHECSVCGLEFAIGQALGGHMRRHRANVSSMNDFKNEYKKTSQPRVPVVKKSNSSRRYLCLDLNLTPLENDFKVWV